jgi:hypothetical protein
VIYWIYFLYTKIFNIFGETVSNKTASSVSVILTVLLLVIFAVLALVFEMVALNGVGERQGMTALGISLICHSAGAILLGILACRSTHLMITKFNLNQVLAATLTVMLGMLAGGTISFLSVLISIPLAGIRSFDRF